MIRVLLVDDDVTLVGIWQEGLASLGFDVMTAYNGNEAMNILMAGEFDVLVTDMYMNNGGGQQLISWSRENKPSLKILAVSGEKLDRILSALDIVEDDGIPTLEKPFEIRQLADVINGMSNNQFF